MQQTQHASVGARADRLEAAALAQHNSFPDVFGFGDFRKNIVVEPPDIETFIQYVGEVHTNDRGLRDQLVQMERFYRARGFTAESDITDVANEMFKMRGVTASNFVQWLGFHTLTLHLNPAPAADNSEHLRSSRNENVRLNATFFNSLAVWLAGAGAAGALFNTMMAPAHNFAGAAEIGATGAIVSIVLRWLAGREIRKLK